jgi:hypothetical protein
MDRVARSSRGACVVVVLALGLLWVPGASASGWSVQPSPSPRGGNPILAAVSCVSSTACVAVGSDLVSLVGPSPERPLVERWNGKRWSIQPTARLQGELTGVSCSSERACTAVGYVGPFEPSSSPYEGTLVERWNGAKWLVQHTPTLGTGNSSLSGVSCVSPTDCTAVGSHDPGGFTGSPPNYGVKSLVERWNGKRWSIQPTPQSGGRLGGVSCASARSCVAVGPGLCPWWHFDVFCLGVRWPGPLVERWNGQRWSIEPTADPLTAVSCTSPTACTAVGPANMAERWNGATWSMEPITIPRALLRIPGVFPTDVSCVSASACTATWAPGMCTDECHSGDGIDPPIVARWNGTRWRIHLLGPWPQIKNDVLAGELLEGVSCPSTTTCTAVGVGGGVPVDHTLVERWTRSG